MRSGVPGFNGERLRQAREAIGLSQTSLADLLGVSKQAVSQYEKGADSPGTDVFDRLRQILQHEAHFFLRRPVASFDKGTCFYRSMAAATKGARAKAEVWQLWVRELVLYLSEYVELPKVTFPLFDDLPQDPNRLGMERVESLAGEARQVWRLGDGPIPNLTYVAEANGAIIVRHVLDADTLDALSLWMVPEQIPLVVLNADKRVAVRSRLDLAHELGHMILHRHLPEEYLRRSELFRLVEDQAFRFGAALLLPAHSFLEDLYSVSLDGLRALKSKWKVSIAMMIERLKHLEIISDEQHRRLRINYSTRQWNREEPLDREIEVEQPTFLIGAFRLLVDERIQTPDQISVNSGFSSGWVQRLLNVSLGTVSPNPPALKVVELKKQA